MLNRLLQWFLILTLLVIFGSFVSCSSPVQGKVFGSALGALGGASDGGAALGVLGSLAGGVNESNRYKKQQEQYKEALKRQAEENRQIQKRYEEQRQAQKQYEEELKEREDYEWQQNYYKEKKAKEKREQEYNEELKDLDEKQKELEVKTVEDIIREKPVEDIKESQATFGQYDDYKWFEKNKLKEQEKVAEKHNYALKQTETIPEIEEEKTDIPEIEEEKEEASNKIILNENISPSYPDLTWGASINDFTLNGINFDNGVMRMPLDGSQRCYKGILLKRIPSNSDNVWRAAGLEVGDVLVMFDSNTISCSNTNTVAINWLKRNFLLKVKSKNGVSVGLVRKDSNGDLLPMGLTISIYK